MAGAFGFDPNYNSGTDGDWFVATTGNNTTGDGSVGNPYATIQKAIDGASANETIRVRGGNYAEELDYNTATQWTGSAGNPTKLARYGNERPVLVGWETLTGLTECVSGDEPVIGANWASCWKVTLAKSAFSSAGTHFMNLNLHEAGSMMPVAFDKATTDNPLFLENASQFHTADSFTKNGSNEITHIVDISVFGAYTEAQILEAFAYVLHGTNRVALQNITAYDGTDTAAIDGLNASSLPDLFCLANIAPNIAQGQWAVVDNGTDVDIYVWPNDTANITSGITYSARGNAINLKNTNYHTIEGFEFEQYASDGLLEAVIKSTQSGTIKTDVTFKQFQVRGTRYTNAAAGGQGAFFLSRMNNIRIEHYTLKEFAGCHGIGNLTGTTADPSSGARVLWGVNTDVEYTPMKFFNNGDCIYAFQKMTRCCHASHANKAIFNNNSDKCLMWGLNYVDCRGYINWSGTSTVAVGMSMVPPTEHFDDARCIVDQNIGSGEPIPGTDGYILNVMCPPGPNEAATSKNSIDIGRPLATKTVTITIASPAVVTYTGHTFINDEPIVFTTDSADLPTGIDAGTTYYVQGQITDNFNISATKGGADINTSGSQSGVHTCTGVHHNYGVFNSVIHGGGNYDNVSWPVVSGTDLGHQGNVYTAFTASFGQDVSDLDASEVSDTTIGNTYTDYTTRDYSLVDGNAIRTNAPADISAIITVLEARFPDFDFYVDMNGYSFMAFDFIGPDSRIGMLA